ncbi:MAG TPA: DUF1501 domain-containing protein [Gemmataceae bacterium]|jgi:hypothetical protein|nr:DUF1501 domain-containing protein [Gemmataceae bacterium]
MPLPVSSLQHPRMSRRTALQAGAIGLLGLGMNHLPVLRSASPAKPHAAKAVIYIFLSGGLSQIDSFDPKPEAPAEIRGEFQPIATRTPGLRIVEHLPLLAQRSHLWSVVHSMTHRSNDHSAGHQIMLSGRSDLPAGFNPSAPRPNDWPSIAAVAGYATQPRNNLPPAAILPEKLIHFSGRVIPGPFAGEMGRRYDPWLIECSEYEPLAYGAYPEYEFDHQRREHKPKRKAFQMPNLTLPQDFANGRLGNRLDLLHHIDEQRRDLEGAAGTFDQYRQNAISLLMQDRVRRIFDTSRADPRDLDRYGRNAFGWSLLMARQLVEAGVKLVQVNLGNDETWDTHGNAFPHLKEKLFPPTDRCLSALLDDLQDRGMLNETLIVMAGEFGRTPKISTLPQYYKLPGRDHWGAVQSVFFAGGGTLGGRVTGSSDKIGGYPKTDPQTPENMAATIYHSLGISSSAVWHDVSNRPHNIYYGEPIRGLG